VNTNQHEKAKDIWEKMLKIDKNNKIALNNLGIYYLQNKNNKKAKDLFEQCLQIDPNFENAKKNLELIKTETGQS
jgi:Tfp pilus assembly protein PilF